MSSEILTGTERVDNEAATILEGKNRSGILQFQGKCLFLREIIKGVLMIGLQSQQKTRAFTV